MYFVPASDREGHLISSFNKWEQAFRSYSNIYLQAHPQKAMELIQYNHVILMASLSYVWDNVYTYDKEFCSHLAVFLERSWGVILQQAWSMCLKDKINHYHANSNNQRFNSSTPKYKRRPVKDLIKASALLDVPASTITDAWNVESLIMVLIFVGKGWTRTSKGSNKCRLTKIQILHPPVQHLVNSTVWSDHKS